MARPLTRVQVLQNRAFLKLLRRTGNARLSAREVGLAYGTMQHRRSRHPAFAIAWEAALVFAGARLEKPRPSTGSGRAGQGPLHRKRSPSPGNPGEDAGPRFRTAGGEVHHVRLRDGRVQLRKAQPGKLTPAAEQAFLAALSATCNVRLSAAAVGASPRAFYRRRIQDAGFAREMRLALSQGYERLEMALLESGLASAFEQDDWRRNEPPAMPPMSVNQALQLMYLHQKQARLLAEPEHVKRRHGESRESRWFRLAAMYEEGQRRAREAFAIAEAERMAAGEPPWGPAGEAVRRELAAAAALLPDLAQVSGWSNADPAKAPHNAGRALFGGWRIAEMEERLAQEGRGWVRREDGEGREGEVPGHRSESGDSSDESGQLAG